VGSPIWLSEEFLLLIVEVYSDRTIAGWPRTATVMHVRFVRTQNVLMFLVAGDGVDRPPHY